MNICIILVIGLLESAQHKQEPRLLTALCISPSVNDYEYIYIYIYTYIYTYIYIYKYTYTVNSNTYECIKIGF
jgi:hypothetical protein